MEKVLNTILFGVPFLQASRPIFIGNFHFLLSEFCFLVDRRTFIIFYWFARVFVSFRILSAMSAAKYTFSSDILYDWPFLTNILKFLWDQVFSFFSYVASGMHVTEVFRKIVPLHGHKMLPTKALCFAKSVRISFLLHVSVWSTWDVF